MEQVGSALPPTHGNEDAAPESGDNPQPGRRALVSDLKLSKPAHRALAAAGYVRLEQFTQVTEAQVLRLHGMGPKALEELRCALVAQGQSFADNSGELE